MKMNAITTHFTGAGFLQQEEIKLLKRLLRHARQESTFLPTL
jgi:hypothetical protein